MNPLVNICKQIARAGISSVGGVLRGACSRHSTPDNSRAVSDIVGFVLTVGIILVGVGIVATVGVDQIEGLQGTQHVENAEGAITVLGGNLDQLQESRATVLSSEIAVHNGRLAIDDGSGTSELQIDVHNTTFGTETHAMRTISYSTDDTSVVYEGGSVVLDNPEGDSIPIRRPAFLCGEERAVVSFVTIHDSYLGQGYSGATADVTTRLNETLIHYPKNRTGTHTLNNSEGVEVTVNSEYEAGWRTSLVEENWTNPSGNTFVCEPDGGGTMPVIVRQTIVDVTVSR